MADVGLIRKRLRAEIDRARRSASTRRERGIAAARAYETLLSDLAVPVFRQLSSVLRAEGIPFEVQTPSDGVRLVSDHNRDDVVQLELDTSIDPPVVMLTTSRMRGSRRLRTERPVSDQSDIAAITEDELIERVIEALAPWLE